MTRKEQLLDASLGLWVDLPKSMVLTREFFSFVTDWLKFDMVALMIDSSDASPEFNWKPKDVEKALKLADKSCLNVGLTTWPYPSKWHIDRQKEQMIELMNVGPVSEWETDQEHNWTPDLVDGFSSYEAAGEYLSEVKNEVCQIQGALNTMTTFTYHKEHSLKSSTLKYVDKIIVQAYAVSIRNGKEIHMNHRFGPGNIQRLTFDRSMNVLPKDVALGAGHAAWDQLGFGCTPEHAMGLSLDTSFEYPIRDHRWWSAKYVYPKSKRFDFHAYQFLSQLRK